MVLVKVISKKSAEKQNTLKGSRQGASWERERSGGSVSQGINGMKLGAQRE